MLQHNASAASQRAHIAHALVVSLHALCCGLPALALLAAALSGAASGVVLASDFVHQIHNFVHAYEVWILAVSAALVVGGGWLEVSHRRHGHQAGFPWLFVLSAACFVFNVGIVLAHRAV
jgi:hypothetical protein